MNGRVYFRMGPLLPDEGAPPQFAQIYIVGGKGEVGNRLAHFPSGVLDERLLEALQAMLHMYHRWVHVFRQVAAEYPVADVQLTLRADGGAWTADRRRYNEPINRARGGSPYAWHWAAACWGWGCQGAGARAGLGAPTARQGGEASPRRCGCCGEARAAGRRRARGAAACR